MPPRDLSANGGAAGSVGGSPAGSTGGSAERQRIRDPLPDVIRILLLSANPLSTGRLAIEEEARAIAQKLRLARDRDTFELITCGAVRPDDLLQYLNQYRPHVVHFSGHGARTGEILLSADGGADMPIGAEALTELFRVMSDDIRVVLLNACYTAVQARAITQHVDFVIGTRAPITDEAATVFAAAFYSALGFGRTVPQAFDQARAALLVHGLPGHDITELLVRPDADLHLLDHVASVKESAISSTASPASQGQPSSSALSSQGTQVSAGSSRGIANNVNPVLKKRMSFDTKMLLGTLLLDVVFFLYGLQSYTGEHTRAETWQAFVFLAMIGMTGGMIRRWLRRR